MKATPIDFDDKQLELAPEVYLEQAESSIGHVAERLEETVRDIFSYLIKINRVTLRPELLPEAKIVKLGSPVWGTFNVTDFFQLRRGNFHSIAALAPGKYPTISRVSTDNGLIGFYEKPEKAVIWKPGTISVSTVTGDAFIQPVPFIATDNVVMLVPKPEYRGLRLTTLTFITVMINEVKWRYSYGRQCYKTKFATTNIKLPVRGNALDEDFMQKAVEGATYWKLVREAFNSSEHPDAGDEVREDSEDQQDIELAAARLDEIRRVSEGVIRGAALEKKLKQWVS